MPNQTNPTWLNAAEFYGHDPLRGKRRALRAAKALELREEILRKVPKDELVEALGGGDAAEEELAAFTGQFRVVRVRSDLLALANTLKARHKANVGRDIGLAAVLSICTLYGFKSVMMLPEFKKPRPDCG